MHTATFCMLIILHIISDCYCSAGHRAVQIIFVQPTDSNATFCSHKPCKTLAYYSKHPSRYLQSDTTVIFLDGRHDIDTGGLIPIRDVSSLEFRAVKFASISCKNSTGFAFLNVSDLSISGITFHSCGARVGAIIAREILHDYTSASQLFCMSERQQVAVLFANVFNLTLALFTVENSTGYGLLAFNILGISVIKNSNFSFNNYYTLSSQVCVLHPKLETIQDCIGGNALFIFSEHNIIECNINQTHILLIENSTFSYGVDLTGIARKIKHCPNDNVVFGGAGIGAKIAPASYKLEIILDGVYSVGNNADSGPNMNFQTFDFVQHFTLTIQNSICGLGNALWSKHLMQPFNSGFYYYKGLKLSSSYYPACWIHTPEMPYRSQITIKDSLFTENRGAFSGAMMFFVHAQYDYRVYEIINIQSCLFQNNFQIAASFESAQDVTIKNSNFSSNLGSAILATHSTFYMLGEILIWNNTGEVGAGISLLYSSYMVLRSNTSVLFLDNHTHSKGGAIYAQESVEESLQICFFQVMNPNALEITELHVNILLINNTSDESGDAVYGGTVDNCIRKYLSDKPGPIAPQIYFDQLFFGVNFELIKNTAEQPSLISSDPKQICHCQNNTVQCPEDQSEEILIPIVVEKSVFPGALFQVMLTTLGQRKGLVRGVIRALPYPDPNGELATIRKISSHSECA